MPIKLEEKDTKDRWNFYIDKLLKAKYYAKLKELKLGENVQSATIRALLIMFINSDIDMDKLKPIIKEQTYITPNNKISKL